MSHIKEDHTLGIPLVVAAWLKETYPGKFLYAQPGEGQVHLLRSTCHSKPRIIIFGSGEVFVGKLVQFINHSAGHPTDAFFISLADPLFEEKLTAHLDPILKRPEW